MYIYNIQGIPIKQTNKKDIKSNKNGHMVWIDNFQNVKTNG